MNYFKKNLKKWHFSKTYEYSKKISRFIDNKISRISDKKLKNSYIIALFAIDFFNLFFLPLVISSIISRIVGPLNSAIFDKIIIGPNIFLSELEYLIENSLYISMTCIIIINTMSHILYLKKTRWGLNYHGLILQKVYPFSIFFLLIVSLIIGKFIGLILSIDILLFFITFKILNRIKNEK